MLVPERLQGSNKKMTPALMSHVRSHEIGNPPTGSIAMPSDVMLRSRSTPSLWADVLCRVRIYGLREGGGGGA